MLRIFLALIVCAFSMPAFAQDYNKSLQTITDMNRIQAQQNPNYERAEKILTRRVIDKKNHVVGEVQDVIFRSNGGLQSVKVDFNRLRLSQPVYLNYHELDIHTASHSYLLSFEDDQIASLYPQLLADIQTASGPGTDEYSLQKTLNMPVNDEKGQALGTITDVLFSAEGDRVEAIYIRLSQGILNGKEIAVPVDSLKLGDSTQNPPIAIASNDLTKAMLDYAGQK